jgi:hypothetical protein
MVDWEVSESKLSIKIVSNRKVHTIFIQYFRYNFEYKT